MLSTWIPVEFGVAGNHRFAANRARTAAAAVARYAIRIPEVKSWASTGSDRASNPATETVTAPRAAVPRFIPTCREVLVIALAEPARSGGSAATAEEVAGGFAMPIPVPSSAKASNTQPIGEVVEAASASNAMAAIRKP